MRRDNYRMQRVERRDCSVIALALAGRMTYKESYLACKATGRKLRGSMCIIQILRAADLLGLTWAVWKHPRQDNGSKYTPKTIGACLPHGYYIVSTPRHVFALINGVVEDWTADRCHRIDSIYHIRKPS